MDAPLWPAHMLPPLARLILTMSLGLLAAHVLEALHWTRLTAKLALPLAHLGRLGETAAASFSLAFFSPSAANALLAEQYAKGAISRREVLLANLFNSSPSYLVHLPSVFSLTFAFLGAQAMIYVGLTFLAALLRTLTTLTAARLLLPARTQSAPPSIARHRQKGWRLALQAALRRFVARLLPLLLFTVPIYGMVFILQQAGWLQAAGAFLAEQAFLPAIPDPKALGIVALGLTGEINLALAAAAPLLDSGTLSGEEITLALLAGNILSSPMRAFRHQFPAYAGYFRPGPAALLTGVNQACRAGSLLLVAAGYTLCVL